MVLEPDRVQIEIFFRGLWAYADPQGYVALRSFYEKTSKVFRAEAFRLSGGIGFIAKTAGEEAYRCANHPAATVFSPLIATFLRKDHAREEDLLEGLALSIDLDQHPYDSWKKLEAVLGQPTLTIRSGSEWICPDDGVVENRLHAHYRIAKPTARGERLKALRRARDLATRLVGGDASGKSMVHPFRCPGSWHRKNDPPVLCVIEHDNSDFELDLDKALAALEAACPKLPVKPNGSYVNDGADWATPIQDIITGRAYHAALVKLSASKIVAGMNPGAVVNELRALMDLSAGPRDDRWQARYDDIPRIVDSAHDKFGIANGQVIEASYTVISGLLEHAKSPSETEFEPEAPKVAAEPKAAPVPPEDNLEAYTHVPGLVGEIVDWIEKTAVRPNRIIALGAAITVIGTLIGRRIATPTRSATHLYVAIIADSGAGKQWVLDCIRRLMSAAKAECHVKGPSRLYSLPAVEDLLIANPLCLFMIDELGAFLQSVTKTSAISNVSGISELLRTLWNASFSSVETGFRKGKPGEIVRCPALSTIGMTTKDEFLTALQGASVNNGFMNRHTVLNADIPIVRRAEPLAEPIVPVKLAKKLERIYEWNNSMLSICNPAANFDPMVLPWGPGAAALWDTIETAAIAYQNANPGQGIYFRRVAEMSVRLATIRAVGQGLEKASVSVEDMEWGKTIAWLACHHMSNAMQDHLPQTPRGAMAEKILGFIQRKGPVDSRRIQQQMVRSRVNSREIQDILKQLMEAGEVKNTAKGYESC